jgi:hypothetical protein
MTKYAEQAKTDSFLKYYNNSDELLHFSSDGRMRNYPEFKKICSEYYTSLEQQVISTTLKKLTIINENLVISGWTGNIKAQFKSRNIMIMNNYSVTNVFRKIDNEWKIIHSHESALPPEIFKKSK